ncbi:amidase domain-containing protein [Hazenella coriacea]|uniref:Putative amidase-like protein n=1 Tax=Hazenella coriacea TaxID=1179467 RepID=A0A4V2UVR7_9BACL|nr:amidase domain-containing protein [Hazenella coriacea]TCS96827.1 putative amidase-like protein [Hazenella coriacea]
MDQKKRLNQTITLVGSHYNRQKAVQYADTYWNSYNPQYQRFEDDCTSFISQCLFAGGIPMVFTKNRNTGWWYRRVDGKRDSWSFSWSVANSLYNYLLAKRSTGLQTVKVEDAKQLELGDVICYDWEGDGRWNHNVIVTRFDDQGDPLVNAHTFNSRHRHWYYQDSPAWTTQTRYAFFHIV